MRKQTKLFSVGFIAIIISLVFINGIIQINLMHNGSNSGSGGENPTFGNSDTQYTVIYGDPTELIVQKTESITIDLYPNGSIKSQRVTVSFTFENEADENCSFDLIDRAEYCDLDTIKFQKGTFPGVLPYEIINSDEDFGVTVLKWSNISVSARSRAEFGYAMVNYKAVPIEVETEYWVNGSLIQIDPLRNEINASVGSFISNIIRVNNIQQGLYSSYDIATPTTICLITLILPYEEEEGDRDIDEPIYSTAPIMTTDLLGIRQVSWIALGDEYEINWSTTVLKGGGWGIIELQPIRFDLIQSADLTGLLFDGLSGLLGLLAAQQAYWASLGLMAMIEELMGMMGILQLLLNDIQTYLGMLSMASYSLINCLLITLIELDMTKTSIQEIYTQISAMYNDISTTFGPLDPITREFDRILGQGIGGIGIDLGTNGPIGTGIPYMSLPLLIDYYGDIERRIVGSFGAQLIELMGSPAFINMTSTEDDFYFIINATATPLPDNSTDFYTLIDIVNLTLPIPIVPLNLTRRYEFQLNVPLDREIFAYIDALFGPPAIPFDLFPYIPGSPGSNVPGFYTWILDIMRVGQAALWSTIGNLTRSLATLMLQLDSSFSAETLSLINATLTGGSIDPSTPITLETGFTGISDLLGMFSGMEEQFSSPFGSPFSDFIPSMGSFSVPTAGVDMSLLENFGFWTALKIYLNPVPRIRQYLNITIPLDFGNMTSDMGGMGDIGGISGMMGGIGFAKSAENGQMSDWDWNYTGLTTASVTQTNLIQDSIDFKRMQLQATGNVSSGTISLMQRFNYTVPATRVTYRLRTDNANPILSVVVVSKNVTGDDVYAIQGHNLSDLTPTTWYEFSYDLRSTEYWDYIDNSFDINNIIGVELRITPQTTATVNLDVDFLNFSREIIPYPYDISILDGYIIGDGVEILPNITTWEKWTDGLMITTIEIGNMTADGVNDIIAGSNDGHVYVINGTDGQQIWNYSADGSIIDLFLEDIVGDSSPEIIFGTVTGKVCVINKTSGLVSNFSIGSNLDYFLCGNLDGIGTCEIIAVNDDNITAVDYYGNFLWNSTVKGSVRSIDVADLDGDGSEEIGVATYRYKIYVLNGTNGNTVWDYITEERPTHVAIGNLIGDTEKELIFGTEQEYCVVLDGMQGNHIVNFTTDAIIRGIYTGNLTSNPYNDILIHTGLVIGENLSAIAGNSLNLLWNFTTPYGFNKIAIQDILSGNYDEVMVSTVDNRFYQLDSSGNLELNFTIPGSINTMTFSQITQPGVNEFIFGMGNNRILVLNGSNQQPLWMTELGIEIITFQFIRTNETIQLLYNLADPITDLLSTSGLSLTGTDDIASLAGFDLGIGGMEGLGGWTLAPLT